VPFSSGFLGGIDASSDSSSMHCWPSQQYSFGQQITGYEKMPIPEDIEIRLEQIENEYYELGAKSAERRHIWPFEATINLKKFVLI
jgi:hypothetical protein